MMLTDLKIFKQMIVNCNQELEVKKVQPTGWRVTFSKEQTSLLFDEREMFVKVINSK